MADPICRWRNPYFKTVREFINLLPKEVMDSDMARSLIESRFEGFFHTPYQLACQLGLYYESEGKYIPRFSYSPKISEIQAYLKKWVNTYYVPNPYTKQGFKNINPFFLHSELCKQLFESKTDLNWESVKTTIFGEVIGNDDILRNTIKTYSDVIQITGDFLTTKEGVIFEDLVDYVYKNPNVDRDNKAAFFENFGLLSTNKRVINDSIITSLISDINSIGLIFDETLIFRFFFSILTKPFVILTGLSGSGKTKLAQIFAMWLCGSEEQYKIVPVGADWTNREPLLGFPNALLEMNYVSPESGVLNLILAAQSNPEKPYFLILDEMNLSHVERYFADFLSTMESGEEILLHTGDEGWAGIPPKVRLPKNLFIVGTVNIDETTYMFSPKVLDRANVIEFRVTADEMTTFLSQSGKVDLEAIKGQGASMEQSFVAMAQNKDLIYSEQVEMNAALIGFFNQLKNAGAEFGYRSASEISRFAAVAEAMKTAWTTEEILDVVIMQKLLPKLHGSRRKLEPVLKTLIKLCLNEEAKAEDYLQTKADADTNNVLYPISLEKLQRMYRGLIDNGFTSYAEA